jgi:hypothetical protein
MGRRIIRYVWVRYGHLNLEWHFAATPAFHIGPAQHAPVLVSCVALPPRRTAVTKTPMSSVTGMERCWPARS